MFLYILGLLGTFYFLQIASASLPKVDSEAQAIITGLYLLALAVFSGLCFAGGAISSAIGQAAQRDREEKAERRAF